METTLTVIFGLIVGSFLNVVIHRLPRDGIVFLRRIARAERRSVLSQHPC
jgi:prepilin signal peptidase PulO-like enzyme (type II secretory pathway)